MKAIFVLSGQPDLVFFHGDQEYIEHLDEYCRRQGIAATEGVDLDALQMQFLPAFSAMDVMDQVESPLSSVVTDEGVTMVFMRFGEYIYMALAGENETTGALMTQLALLRDMANMLFGPVTTMLKPPSAADRKARWAATSKLMETVRHQQAQEQSFLVHAVENIRVSPHVKRTCIEALEYSLGGDRNQKTAWGSHGLLFVGNKLLAKYSKSGVADLRSSDVFLVSLYIQDLFAETAPTLDQDDPPPATPNMTISAASDGDDVLGTLPQEVWGTPATGTTPHVLGGVQPPDSVSFGGGGGLLRMPSDVAVRRSSVRGGVDHYYPAQENPQTPASQSRPVSIVSADSLFASPDEEPSDAGAHSEGTDGAALPPLTQAQAAALPDLDLGSLADALPDLEGLSGSNTATTPPATDTSAMEPQPSTESPPAEEGAAGGAADKREGEGEGEGEGVVASEEFADEGMGPPAPVAAAPQQEQQHPGSVKQQQQQHARSKSVSSMSSAFSNEQFEEARSGNSYDGDVSQYAATDGGAAAASAGQAAGGGPAAYQKTIRRQPVYLQTPTNRFAPHVLYCAQVAPAITLVVLKEGRNGPLSDLMHTALETLKNIEDLGNASLRRERTAAAEAEISSRIHMAVRGATGQAIAHTHINGNYTPLEAGHDGYVAYERTTKDAYLFHNKLVGAWCIGEGLGDLGACVAMCTDQATSPELIESAWEVYDHDLREFHSDERLRIRCVRGDGALRNRDGHWAKQSTNGSYYCGKSAQCLCGYCNGQCGPFDGCNCASCKMLDTSENYGNLELALLVQREAQQNKEVVAENEKTLKRETDALINVLRAVVQTGAAVISKNTERILNRAAARLLGFARKVDHHSRWQGVTDQAESLAKTLRTFVGEAISQSNLKGTPEEEQNMQDMQTYVSTILKDYIDFLHVKTHRNVTMTTYLDRFPGLTHFIYVDRSQNTVVAPCLSPAQGGSRPERAVIRSLKERVWEMHAYAQVNRDQGYTTLMYKAGDFQYAYYLWFEDNDGFTLTPDEEAFDPALFHAGKAVGQAYYQQLVDRLFPEVRQGTVHCYELYMVHLAVVPYSTAVRHGQRLVAELRSN